MVFAPKEVAASIGWETRNDSSTSDNDHHDKVVQNNSSRKSSHSAIRKENRNFSDLEKKSKKRGRDKGNLTNAIMTGNVSMGDDLSPMGNSTCCSNVVENQSSSYYGPQYFGPQPPPGLHCDDIAEDPKILPPGTIVSVDIVNDIVQNVVTFEGSSCNSIPPPKIAIIGRAKVQVLEGEFEILGYRLTPSSLNDVSIVLESPSWMSAICIEPLGANGKIKLSSLEKMICTFELSSTQGVKSISITDRWNSLANDVWNSVLHHEHDDDSRKVMVCGAKGVGKSTMVRYLVNRILSMNGWLVSSQSTQQDKECPTEVAVLDCDVGQPEFSPPGMVSLTIVSKPLLSPPHAHMVLGGRQDDFTVANVHERCCFYGFTSSKANPMRYMDAVMEAYQCYETIRKERKNIPLIINTDGWVKGMGFEILSSLINACRPTNIVQLVGSTKTKFFDLTPHASSDRNIHVVETSGGCIYDTSNQSPEMSRTTSLASMESWRDLGDSKKWQREYVSPVAASFTRSLRICTYFLGGFEQFLTTGATFEKVGIVDEYNTIALKLSSMKPLMVPFACLDCFVLDQDGRESIVAKDNLFETFNSSIVGLCDDGRDSTTKAGMRKCFGLGLVRSIDLKYQIFYILTPVKLSYLQTRVKSMVKGQIQLPLEAVYCGGLSESFPYLSFEGMSVGIGCDVMKSKNANIKK
jgi:polynucleotide 5'-hydroxyl-kinase GRC3/NOL9